MGEVQGGPSEEDLKIRPGEPETRVSNVDFARDLAKTGHKAESYGAELREKGMGDVAEELRPGVDKVYDNMEARQAADSAENTNTEKESARVIGEIINQISGLDYGRTYKLDFSVLSVETKKAVISEFSRGNLETSEITKIYSLPNRDSLLATNYWWKTSVEDVYLTQNQDATELTFFKANL